MGSGSGANSSVVVSAFHAAMLHQGLLLMVLFILASFSWNILRTAQLRQAQRSQGSPVRASFVAPESPARRLLRISFGLIWIFDGILQGQSSMPLGMIPQVVQPAADSSPSWVQHLVNIGTTIWSYHPVVDAAAAVWIQVGIGIWLLVGPRGNWSRAAGVISVGWGLTVWIFGEAFGGIFSPGLTWLFGAPGAVLFYCLAGTLIALPENSWKPRLGRIVMCSMGAFFIGMALLQAWPGRGFWQGQPNASASAGSLTSMVQQMAQTPQPHWISSLINMFANFDAAHGWGVNFFIVLILALLGASFFSKRRYVVKIGVIAGIAICILDWLFVEDIGFFGGVGTDPNSMIPIALVLAAGYLAMTRVPLALDNVTPMSAVSDPAPWYMRLVSNPSYAMRGIATMVAIGVVLVGALPMAASATESNADPIINQALNGVPEAIDKPAPEFNLVDQNGRPVSLASLHGKDIALTFLDDVCTSACPLIAQELKQTDGMLGAASKNVEMIAVNANPRFISPEYLAAFDKQEQLQAMPNWLFLTGSLAELKHTWTAYGITVNYLPAGAMIGHSLYTYVIDPSGKMRYLIDSDPGPGTDASESSFSVTLTGAMKTIMGQS